MEGGRRYRDPVLSARGKVTTLVSENEIAQSIDVIIHGVVETSVMTETGAPRVVGQLRSSQHFGLTSMRMETSSFQQFTAKINVTLIRIDIDCLRRFLLTDPICMTSLR
jgi:CRP-like cAMP-binding protein